MKIIRPIFPIDICRYFHFLSGQGQDKVKERPRQCKHNRNRNYNLVGFEINLETLFFDTFTHKEVSGSCVIAFVSSFSPWWFLFSGKKSKFYLFETKDQETHYQPVNFQGTDYSGMEDKDALLE